MRGDVIVAVVLVLAARIFIKLSSFVDWEEVVDALLDKQSREVGVSFALLTLVAVGSLIIAGSADSQFCFPCSLPCHSSSLCPPAPHRIWTDDCDRVVVDVSAGDLPCVRSWLCGLDLPA
eukprot:746839-Hanusia_phi.AAC.3